MRYRITVRLTKESAEYVFYSNIAEKKNEKDEEIPKILGKANTLVDVGDQIEKQLEWKFELVRVEEEIEEEASNQ